ncbi:cysteine-rich receptor-like protein kinase 8 [Rosa chinensis]|uniref:cysteine-rich receptor-like protein kinase 8 n=1 Tax=Rosa chinensis TaxID=74649 RepID=UPI001AD90647|nr:cysteine-rich receptor-like protein kinase 8 [Rosa chinensis]
MMIVDTQQRHPQGKGLDFVDEELAKGYSLTEVRCIHIGLLCVQDDAANRPTMPEVVFMLSSETDAPQPKQPSILAGGIPSHCLTLHDRKYNYVTIFHYKQYVSWVQNVVRQFGPYPVWALEH